MTFSCFESRKRTAWHSQVSRHRNSMTLWTITFLKHTAWQSQFYFAETNCMTVSGFKSLKQTAWHSQFLVHETDSIFVYLPSVTMALQFATQNGKQSPYAYLTKMTSLETRTISVTNRQHYSPCLLQEIQAGLDSLLHAILLKAKTTSQQHGARVS